MKYWITFILITTYGCANVFAANSRVLYHMDEACFADTGEIIIPKKQSVAIGANYGTDVSFFGRTSAYRYPFISTDAIYNNSTGLFVYSSLWKVLATPPNIDEADLGIGYSHRFFTNIKTEFSYTKSFISDASLIIKSSASNDLNLKNAFDWKVLKTSVTLDYLFGKTSDFFVTVSNSKYFESNFSVFDDKDYVTFEPTFTMIFGTQNFVQSYSQNHDFNMNPGGGRAPAQPYDPEPTNMSAAKNSQFNILNYNIKLPLAYNRPHYTLEAAYKYAIPVNVRGPLINNHESFFYLTFYYVFY